MGRFITVLIYTVTVKVCHKTEIDLTTSVGPFDVGARPRVKIAGVDAAPKVISPRPTQRSWGPKALRDIITKEFFAWSSRSALASSSGILRRLVRLGSVGCGEKGVGVGGEGGGGPPIYEMERVDKLRVCVFLTLSGTFVNALGRFLEGYRHKWKD